MVDGNTTGTFLDGYRTEAGIQRLVSNAYFNLLFTSMY